MMRMLAVRLLRFAPTCLESSYADGELIGGMGSYHAGVRDNVPIPQSLAANLKPFKEFNDTSGLDIGSRGPVVSLRLKTHF